MVCESNIIIQFFHTCLIKNEVLHLLERCGAASPTNVILFVGDHPASFSASSVGQVMCESTIIIQLRSVMLDEKRSISFEGAMLCSLSHKCNDHPTSLSASSVGQVGCESTIIIQLRSVVLDKN